MVRVRAISAEGLGVSRSVVKVDGLWKSTALIELRGELELSKFPRSVGTALRDAGRARIVPRPPLGGDLRPIASIEQWGDDDERSEEHTSELQSLMRISYAVFCLNKKKNTQLTTSNIIDTRDNSYN